MIINYNGSEKYSDLTIWRHVEGMEERRTELINNLLPIFQNDLRKLFRCTEVRHCVACRDDVTLHCAHLLLAQWVFRFVQPQLPASLCGWQVFEQVVFVFWLAEVKSALCVGVFVEQVSSRTIWQPCVHWLYLEQTLALYTRIKHPRIPTCSSHLQVSIQPIKRLALLRQKRWVLAATRTVSFANQTDEEGGAMFDLVEQCREQVSVVNSLVSGWPAEINRLEINTSLFTQGV